MRYKHTRKIITESSMLNEGAMQWIIGIITAVGGIGMAYRYREQIAGLLRKINPSIGNGFLMFMNLIGGGVGKAKDSVVSAFGGQTNQEVPNNSQSEMQSQDPKAYAQYKIDQLKKIPFMNAVESAIASGTLPPEIDQNLPAIMNSPIFAKYKDLSVYDAIQLASSKDASNFEQSLAIQAKAMVSQALKIPSNQLWSETPPNAGNVNTNHSTPNPESDLTRARELTQSQDPKAYAQYKIDQLKTMPFLDYVQSVIASGKLPPEIVQNLPAIMNSPIFAKYKDLSVYDAIQLASSKDASNFEQSLAIQAKAMVSQALKIPSNQLWSETPHNSQSEMQSQGAGGAAISNEDFAADVPSNAGNVNTNHSTPRSGFDFTKSKDLMTNPLNFGGQSLPAQPVAQSEPNPQLNNSDFEKQSQHYEPSYPTIQNDLKNIATGASNIGSSAWNWAKETGGNIADWVKQKYDYYGSMTPKERVAKEESVKTESVMYIKRLNEIATPAQPPLPAGVPSAPMPAPATPPAGFTPAPPVKQSPAPTPPPAQAPPATPGSPMPIVPAPKKPTGAPPEFIRSLRIKKRIR